MKRYWWAMLLAAVALACVLGTAVLFPYDLRDEKAAARREGIPLTYAEIPWKPVPKAEDAAPWYAEFDRRFKADMFTAAEGVVTQKIIRRQPLTAAEQATLRHALATRQPILDALHTAVAMPSCDHQKPRSWLGGGPLLTLAAQARYATNMLRYESFLLAMDSRYVEAVQVQSQGYTVASHMYQGHSLIAAQVAGIGMHSAADAGMMNILETAGPDVDVARAVRRAVAASPEPNLARCLRAETPGMLELFTMVRSWSDLLGGSGFGSSLLSAPPIGQTVRLIRGPLSAGYLHWHRKLVAAADQPSEKRREAMQKVGTEVMAVGPPGPVMWLPRLFIPTFVATGTQDDQQRARNRVLIAATHVMEHRARAGAWPTSLENAMPEPPMDPFHTGKPLGYRREGKGFVVFSVGESGSFAARPGQDFSDEAVFQYPRPAISAAPGGPP